MNLQNDTALVVLSGGQDSTTCLFWAKHYYKHVHAVTFNYGQRHSRELAAAQTVAMLAGVESHEIVTLGPVLQGTSPLTNPNEQLEMYSDFKSMDAIIGDRVEKTFVPMRNALFLNIAANRAVCLGARTLVTGVCEADNANYPDCRRSFIDAQQATVNEALGLENGKGLEISTPLITLSKADSIHLARNLAGGAYEALAFSHTAYDGNYPPVGADHASVLRAYGFEQAMVPDPLVVRANMEGLMELPHTPNYRNTTVDLNDLRQKIAALQHRVASDWGAL